MLRLEALSYFQRPKVTFFPQLCGTGLSRRFYVPRGPGWGGTGSHDLVPQTLPLSGWVHSEHLPHSQPPGFLMRPEPLRVSYLMTSVSVCVALLRPAGCLSHVQTCCLAQKGARALAGHIFCSARRDPGQEVLCALPGGKALVGWGQARGMARGLQCLGRIM